MIPFRPISAALLLFSAGVAAAADRQPAPVSPTTAPSLSPSVESALRHLQDESYATREAALADLQRALAGQVAAMVSTRDPEVESRLAGLIEFQNGILRWAGELLKMPRPRRLELLEFGLKPDLLPHMAKLYADRPQLRREAVRALAKVEGNTVTDLLAARVEDPDRGVYVAAMEALWDRPPTDLAVEALWNRAVAAGIAVYATQIAQRGEVITFMGRSLGAESISDTAVYRRAQDHTVACDVLVHLRAPQVTAKLQKMLAEIEASYTGAARGRTSWVYSGTQEPMKNFARLMRTYKPPEAVPAVYRIATTAVTQRSQGQVNGAKYFWSNRTWAIALLYELTDRAPEDAKLVKQSMIGGMWTATGEAEEDAVVKELKSWWEKNAGTYTRRAATQPGT